MKRLTNILLIIGGMLLLTVGSAMGQSRKRTASGAGFSDGTATSEGRSGEGRSWGRDTTSNDGFVVPIGVTQWTIDETLGSIIPAENTDTVVHMFQAFNETSGYNGQYSLLGNLGSPRLSRIYMDRAVHGPMFLWPYSFLIRGLDDFRFSNTLSPFTNLAYHKVGNRTNGQERLHAYFATNINKQAGVGFKADYLYGRGYYNNQANSQFGGTLFGYYLGDRYNMHAYVNYNHLKMAENGGIENDEYITNPQSFQQRYGSKDIPTLLSETWNRNENQEAKLTHRYNLGFYREIEIADSLKPKMPSDKELLAQIIGDSIRNVLDTDTVQRRMVLDSLQQRWKSQQIIPTEFVPVTSIIHTITVNNLRHTYYAHETPESYYTNHYYGDLTNVKDRTKALSVKNVVGIALREGFNKWAQMGIAAFLSYNQMYYTLPMIYADGRKLQKRYNEYDLAAGGQITRTQGRFIHYDVKGQFSFMGNDKGSFNVDGTMNLDIPISKRDTMALEVHGLVEGFDPDFYMRHFHSQFLWWDHTDWSLEYRSRIEGTLHLPRTGTHLSVGFENIKNHTHLAMQNTFVGEDPAQHLPADYSHNVVVRQASSNIQVFYARLRQELKFGPVHWDNDITYQTSSNAAVLPLPKINIYSNLYLTFKIAKVLNVELGGDVRYFTKYYAPDYSPAIQQFAVQDANNPRIKVGNYPIVNVYANLHLKHCRLYISMNHVNEGSGRMFWAPYYPMDPRALHFGVSWNFFN